jgi:hypothetical protein
VHDQHALALLPVKVLLSDDAVLVALAIEGTVQVGHGSASVVTGSQAIAEIAAPVKPVLPASGGVNILLARCR